MRAFEANYPVQLSKFSAFTKSSEEPLTIGKRKYKADLIPPGLIVARYFADKRAHVEELQADLDAVSQELESLIEEHCGEEGLLADAMADAGKVTKTTVTTRLKAIKGDGSADEEREVLQVCKTLFDRETSMKKGVKDAGAALDMAVFGKYGELTEEEIRELVVVDKWLATLEGTISAEVERVTQQLAKRVKDLEERYAEPLPQIVEAVEVLSGKVEEHLRRMGLVLN